jgi:biopolymer transport protein ExbD
MIKIPSHHDSSSNEDVSPDLTPMLDILFIMLVFFMLTTGVVLQSLELELPSSVMEELTLLNEPKHIMLEIRKEEYSLSGEVIIDFEKLRQSVPAIIKEKPDYELIVAGDKDISIERLLKVLTYLQSQGINAANILMQHENEK